MLSPSSGHIDTSLTNVSVMYRNSEFVADEVFQPLPVDKQSNKFFIYGLDNLRADDDRRRPAAMSNEMTWNLSAAPYYCDGHAQHTWIPDEDRENFDAAINLDTDSTVQLTDKILLNKEVDMVNQINAALTPVDLSAGGYANAWDTATVDPVAVIDAAKETIALQIGMTPNTLLLSRPVFRGLRNNPLVKARVGGALNGIGQSLITAQQLAVVLEVKQLIVAEAVQVTSKEGQAIASRYVWGKNALLFYKPPSPGLRTPALGYQFKWNTGRLGSLVFRDRSNKRHADWIEVMQYYANQVISAPAGVIWSNATQF